jgi:hypothetical protein
MGKESLHKISNDNGVRVVNFATSKNLRLKGTMFSNHNIHKYIWMSPDGKTHNQIDHILIDTQRHLSVLDVRSFRAADCDTDHYLVVAKVRERLKVNKQRSHRFHMERFNLKKLNEAESKEQLRSQIGLQLWETIRENIKISAKESLHYYELKKHKPWFDKRCSKSLDQSKQANCSGYRIQAKQMGII